MGSAESTVTEGRSGRQDNETHPVAVGSRNEMYERIVNLLCLADELIADTMKRVPAYHVDIHNFVVGMIQFTMVLLCPCTTKPLVLQSERPDDEAHPIPDDFLNWFLESKWNTSLWSAQRFDAFPLEIDLGDEDHSRQRALVFLRERTKELVASCPGGFHDILEQELRDKDLYKTYWKNAIVEFNKRRDQLTSTNPGFPDEYHIALICYTSKFYEDFNKRTRELQDSKRSFQSYPYKSFFYLLLEACGNITGPDLPPEQKNLFAGFPDECKVGERGGVLFPQFQSTSRLESKAKYFATRGNPKKWTIFHILDFQDTVTYTVMDQHSLLEREKEVLMGPMQAFVCVSIRPDTRDARGKHVELRRVSAFI